MKDKRSANFSAILLSSFICLALLLTAGVFGAGVGAVFSSLSLSLVLVGIVSLLAFFVAGWALSALTAPGENSFFQTLAMWALVIVTNAYILGSSVSNWAGLVYSQLGLGIYTTNQSAALLEQLREMRPQIITEVEITDGRAVSTLSLGEERGSLAKELIETTKEEADSIESGVSSAVEEVEPELKKSAKASFWIVLGGLILSLASAGAGARLQEKRVSAFRK